MPKQLLFINIETTGLPPKYEKLTKKNVDKYPNIIAFHFKIGYYDKKEKLVKIDRSIYSLVKQNNMIPEQTIGIHGITNEMVNEKGVDICLILNKLKEIINTTYMIISHSTSFRLECIKAELLRNNIEIDFDKCKIVDLCNFNHNYDHPKLEDLYQNLYERKFKKSHPRKSNINIMIKCFEYLYNKFINNMKEKELSFPEVEEKKLSKKTTKKSINTRKKIFKKINKS
jgi:DNA polymerase III epsilon subunit-like protein